MRFSAFLVLSVVLASMTATSQTFKQHKIGETAQQLNSSFQLRQSLNTKS